MRAPYVVVAFSIVLVGGMAASGSGCSQAHPESSRSPRGQANSLLVVDGVGAPVAYQQVLVAGELVTTGVDGRAPLSALPKRYDVALRGNYVYVFQDLSTRAPVVRLSEERSIETRRVHIDVYAALAEDEELDVLQDIAAEGVGSVSYGFNSDGEGHYWVDVAWSGPERATLTLRAFTSVRDPETELVTHYSGYAEQQQKVTSGDEVSWSPDFGPSPFAEKTIRVETLLAPEEHVFQHPIQVRSKTGGGGALGTGDQLADARLLVPDLPDVTFDVGVDTVSPTGGSAAWAYGVRAGEHVRLATLATPQPLVAFDDSAPPCPDEFAWTPVDEAVYYLSLRPRGGEGDVYEIAAASPRVHLPDLSRLGVRAPSGTYEWSPRAVAWSQSIDAYAAREPGVESWSEGENRGCTFQADGSPTR